MNISLTDHFSDYVSQLVESGRYSNASEVVRAALRLLEDQDRLAEAKIQAAINRGIDQLDAGKGIPFNPQALKQEGRRRLAEG